MPRTREPDPIAGLFATDHKAKRIAKLLNRAVDKRIAAAARSVPKVRFGKGGGRKAQRVALAGLLAKAIGVRKGGRDKPSLRMKAPDTGGRSFHFEHSTVSKKASNAGRKTSRDGSRIKGDGVAAAHLSYIERESAVERLRGIEDRARDAELEPIRDVGAEVAAKRKRGRPTKAEAAAKKALEEARGAGWERSLERDHATFEKTLEGPGRAAAGQGYIEDPAKTRDGEGLSSWGTIGETREERLEFWRLVEEHEPAPDARVQNRLIVELPHQATPEARREIMERFVAPFAEKGLPYHVAIHAPTAKNDGRNFHAHVVARNGRRNGWPNPRPGPRRGTSR